MLYLKEAIRFHKYWMSPQWVLSELGSILQESFQSFHWLFLLLGWVDIQIFTILSNSLAILAPKPLATHRYQFYHPRICLQGFWHHMTCRQMFWCVFQECERKHVIQTCNSTCHYTFEFPKRLLAVGVLTVLLSGLSCAAWRLRCRRPFSIVTNQ